MTSNQAIQEQNSGQGNLSEIAWEFLRLGFIEFGRPAAHSALMEQRFVRRSALYWSFGLA
jgi:chromate transport protein ChrA